MLPQINKSVKWWKPTDRHGHRLNCVFPRCRFQPPAAVVLHDLLHHPARAPRLAGHERVQEEVRLGVGRVLPNGALPDHPARLLSKARQTLLSRGLFLNPVFNVCKGFFCFLKKIPQIWTNKLIFRIFSQPMNCYCLYFSHYSGLKVLQVFNIFNRKKTSFITCIVWRIAFKMKK